MIKFVDLNRTHDLIRQEIDIAIKNVIDNSSFIMGKPLDDFEKDFAEYCGTKYCLGVANGGDALRLALLSLGVGKEDEVITVANTFSATVDAIMQVGATPILVDCDEYFNIDVSQIEGKINKKTKALLPVHLYGQVANMDEIMRLAKKYSLKVVEDAAQAAGADFKGKKAGTFGDVSCFSFYPGKNIGALGDGGAILTKSEKIVDQIRMLRNYGISEKYYEKIIGFNSRLDAIQAAVLSVKLKYLDKWNEQRREIAKIYNKLLEGVVETPKEQKQGTHIYHLYVIKVGDKKIRDKLQEYLASKDISTVLHYPIPVHLQEAYKSFGFTKGDFPIAEENSETILSIPMFPGITEDEIREVAKEIKGFM